MNTKGAEARVVARQGAPQADFAQPGLRKCVRTVFSLRLDIRIFARHLTLFTRHLHPNRGAAGQGSDYGHLKRTHNLGTSMPMLFLPSSTNSPIQIMTFIRLLLPSYFPKAMERQFCTLKLEFTPIFELLHMKIDYEERTLCDLTCRASTNWNHFSETNLQYCLTKDIHNRTQILSYVHSRC